MKKAFLLMVVPALLAALAFAQTPAADNTDQTNIKGCLAGSSGNYTIAEDNTGHILKISGSSVDLKPHVGHDVALIGQRASEAGSAAAANSFAVTGLNMISEQCAAAAAAPAATVAPPAETAATPAAAAPAPPLHPLRLPLHLRRSPPHLLSSRRSPLRLSRHRRRPPSRPHRRLPSPRLLSAHPRRLPAHLRRLPFMQNRQGTKCQRLLLQSPNHLSRLPPRLPRRLQAHPLPPPLHPLPPLRRRLIARLPRPPLCPLRLRRRGPLRSLLRLLGW